MMFTNNPSREEHMAAQKLVGKYFDLFIGNSKVGYRESELFTWGGAERKRFQPGWHFAVMAAQEINGLYISSAGIGHDDLSFSQYFI